MVILKGSGHFAIGFIIGYFVFITIKRLFNKNWNIKIWGPLLPLILGGYASFPYFLEVNGESVGQKVIDWKMNVFLFYNFFHFNKYLIFIFNKFYISILGVSFFYCLLIIHYIKLIKILKRNAE